MRCISATFIASFIFGAALGITILSARSFAEQRAREQQHAQLMHEHKAHSANISFAFEDAPLKDVARFVSNALGREITADLNVDLNRPVTFASYRPITQAQLYQGFVRLLQEQRMTLTQQGPALNLSNAPLMPVRLHATNGYKTSPTPDLSSLFLQAREQLLHPERIKGAVLTVESVGCLGQEVTFETVAIGSLWSQLGFRAGDSFTMLNNTPPFRANTEQIEIKRRGESVQIQYSQAM